MVDNFVKKYNKFQTVNLKFSIIIGLGQKILTISGRVSHLQFGSGFGKFPPKKSQIFQFFPFGSKKISWGRMKKYPGKRRVDL